jgi:hypothetical protein
MARALVRAVPGLEADEGWAELVNWIVSGAGLSLAG